jgi:hypothetical protein
MIPPDYPQQIYRSASKKVLRQGDIALCEHVQLRPRSGERAGPGAATTAGPQLPFFGDPIDYEIELPDVGGGPPQKRVIRLWQGPVMVVGQNCEIEYADDQDSRLLVAPLASRALWQEGPWDWLRRNQLPGYLYLPPLTTAEANFELQNDLAESTVVLASMSLVSRALVRNRRVISLAQPMLPHLQEKLSRFLTTRGYASDREVQSLAGKRVIDVKRTDETVSGPSRLYKIVLGEAGNGGGDGDDEITLSVGCRPA